MNNPVLTGFYNTMREIFQDMTGNQSTLNSMRFGDVSLLDRILDQTRRMTMQSSEAGCFQSERMGKVGERMASS
jgi:hypothetical protein